MSASVVRIWDLPTRLFHWALAACVIGALVTVKLGGLYMDWHVRFGLATFGLILFRLIWGIIGPRYARFAQFVRGPGALMQYLRGKRYAGHNPLGALSVVAMMLVLGFQATSGLFTTDDIMIQGPLYGYASEDTASLLTRLHKQNEWIIYGLLALHLLAVAWYAVVRRKRLVRAMINGDAPVHELPGDAPAARDGWGVRVTALLLAGGITGLVLWLRTLEVVPAY